MDPTFYQFHTDVSVDEMSDTWKFQACLNQRENLNLSPKETTKVYKHTHHVYTPVRPQIPPSSIPCFFN